MKTNITGSGRFDFVGTAWIFGGISALLVIASLIFLMTRGLTYGIDFAGGTEVQVKFAEKIDMQQLRALAEREKLLNVGLQAFGEGNEYIIRFQTQEGANDKETNDIQNQSVEKLRASIETEFAAQGPEIRRVDSVGPQVGAELKRNGLLAVFYCLLVILLYVSIRFDYNYAPGAVVCLAHDAIITLAIFELTGREMNVSILAAILTLIGFSLNDTIVVFDRIRENESEVKAKGIAFTINKAINDMLGRTIVTSGTTFVSALMLYIFASGTVSDIAFAMSIGIAFGTYSSVYVAAPFILLMEKLRALKTAA